MYIYLYIVFVMRTGADAVTLQLGVKICAAACTHMFTSLFFIKSIKTIVACEEQWKRRWWYSYISTSSLSEDLRVGGSR